MPKDRSVTDAIIFARKYHGNQEYGTGNYVDEHLIAVLGVGALILEDFKKACLPMNLKVQLCQALILHDVLEDTSASYSDILRKFDSFVADICYALQTPKGKTRKERHSIQYYEGIENTPWATFIKLCDRYANIQYSIETGSKMLEVYRKEQENFCYWLKSRKTADKVERLATDIIYNRVVNLLKETE